MESKTYLKNLRESTKKLRFFLDEVKKRNPVDALDYLYYAPQKAGRVLYQALKSALNNAKNTLKVPDDLLEWKQFTIEEGQKLKRYKPGGRGTAKPYKIRFSHIKIVLEAKPSVDTPKQSEQLGIKKAVEKKNTERVEKTESIVQTDKRVYDVEEKSEVSTKSRKKTK